jgi:hypothetical protein
MKNAVSPISLACFSAATLVAGLALWNASPVHGASAGLPGSWDRAAAERYLDQREIWWQQWPSAQKEQGTVCISCHTVVPYAMVRPALRRDLGESAISAPEATMMASLEKRVANWAEMIPFYSDAKSGPGKTAESHATEAVLNAIMLASVDASQGHLRPITRTAFDNAWALQEDNGPLAGAWKWQDFHLAPWETSASNYQGAALLMVEALNAPDGYAREPEVRAHLDRLRDYLRANYETQSPMNQLYVLWASAREPGLIAPAQRAALLAKLASLQRPDGGWCSSAIESHGRTDGSPEPVASDGYATGLAVIALVESKTSRKDPLLQCAVAWLTQNQQTNGTWTAVSINKERNPKSIPAAFMTDAATAYAVLALELSK